MEIKNKIFSIFTGFNNVMRYSILDGVITGIGLRCRRLCRRLAASPTKNHIIITAVKIRKQLDEKGEEITDVLTSLGFTEEPEK